MDIKTKLQEIGVGDNNGVVIGSGILNVLNLRESKDIDLIVTKEKYDDLSRNNRFIKKENHGRIILMDDDFEIGTKWIVLGKTWEYEDLLNHSVVIDDIRYNKIDFLLKAKQSWINDGEGRQKDMDDVKIMEEYLTSL